MAASDGFKMISIEAPEGPAPVGTTHFIGHGEQGQPFGYPPTTGSLL